MSAHHVGLSVDGSSGNIRLEASVAAYLASAFAIFKARQKKYGSGSIARRGPVGVLVRLDDKLARLDRLFMEGAGDTATDESVEDTCLDVANYAIIILLCHAGQWPGWTPSATGEPLPPAPMPPSTPPCGTAFAPSLGWDWNASNYPPGQRTSS